jgi:dTDP-4-dehydrorhamnose 3,5-epimerase
MPLTITPSTLTEVKIITPALFSDPRGFFLESYHQRKFAELGLTETFVQDNHSRSGKGVLRGLHLQDATAPMGKLVRCALGAIFDVAVDVRAGSPTCGQWFGLELNAETMQQLWIPAGFAHGFATLTDMADVQYKCTNFYTPTAERTLAWNDPDINIAWPLTNPVVSPRDAQGLSLQQYLANPAFHYHAS